MAKHNMPRRLTMKRVSIIIFWLFMLYVAFAATIALSRSNPPIDIEALKPSSNLAMTTGAESFANNFASQYFSWSPENRGIEDCKKRLEPYLADSLDVQAGLNTRELVSSSKLVKSQVWKTIETGENQAEITLRVQYVTSLGKSSQTQLKYFVVPVVAQEDNFLVYEVPRFIKPPNSIEFKAQPREQYSTVNDSKLVKEIGAFIESFFKIYASGTPEEINYFSRAEIDGLQKVLEYTKLERYSVHPTDDTDRFHVMAEVTFSDHKDKSQFTYPFQLYIKKEAERWYVTDFNM